MPEQPTISHYQNLQIPGYDRKRDNPHDFYDTHPPFIHAALSLLPDSFVPRRILDPGAGKGRWGAVAHTLWPDAQIDAVELDPAHPPVEPYTNWYQEDFRDWMPMGGLYDLVCGNPPFSMSNGKKDLLLAESFIRQALGSVHVNGVVYFLLKSVYIEGESRFDNLFWDMPPKYIYQSAARIPYRPDTHGKSTNTVAYAMFLWERGVEVDDTVLRWFNWKNGKLKVKKKIELSRLPNPTFA